MEKVTYAKCRCCEHQIEVKTIDDMLQRAYEIIDSDAKVSQLLVDLKLDKYSVGITQEYTRFKLLSDPYANFTRDYRCVQGSESGIYLGFNENFTALEVVEIMPRMFRVNHIRGYRAQFNDLSDELKLAFLENAFGSFNQKLKGVNSYIEVKYLEHIGNTEIVLKMPNDRLSNNKAYAFYPDSLNANEYPYFTFDIDHDGKDGRLERIRLELYETESINEPVSKWLHQRPIDMYPDYGGVFLWFDGAAGGVESIDNYDLEGSKLAKKLEDWQRIFEDSFFKTDIDWVQFDRVGRELFLELRDVIKNDYILTYAKSYEEICGTQGEHDAMKKHS
ncbi:MAG: hypothetical protein ACOX39_04325 [Arcobacteraceae bacterium]